MLNGDTKMEHRETERKELGWSTQADLKHLLDHYLIWSKEKQSYILNGKPEELESSLSQLIVHSLNIRNQ